MEPEKETLQDVVQELMTVEREPLENRLCPITLDGYALCRGECDNCYEYYKFKQEYLKDKNNKK